MRERGEEWREDGRERRRYRGRIGGREGGTQIVVGSGKGSVCKYKCLQQL